jgi:hypothetical protein
MGAHDDIETHQPLAQGHSNAYRTQLFEPGDLADVGDEVVFHGDHGNLFRAIVVDRALSPLSHVMRYRVVDNWSESDDPDAGKWVGHDRLYMIHPLSRRGQGL